MQFKDLISVAALLFLKKWHENRVVAMEADCHKCCLDLKIIFHIQDHKISFRLFYKIRTTGKLGTNLQKWLTRVNFVDLFEFITANICCNVTM